MLELFIKNMVCNRCIIAVRQELLNNGIEPISIDLGVVRLTDEIDQNLRDKLARDLKALGFELLEDAKSKLVDQIKTFIINKIHHVDFVEMASNWSQLISMELNHEYKFLSSLFSSVEKTTIEQYIIRQKVERVKELLLYEELSLSEISYRLGYSSVQHLSQQFKKITGTTPSQYKSSGMDENKRNPLDAI
jgi:AraC family transcriptional regulator